MAVQVNVGDLVYAVGGSILAFMVLAWSHTQLAAHNMTCMCPPLGAVAVLLFAAPAAPLGKQFNTAVGFLAGSTGAFVIYQLVGDGFMKEFGGTRALMVGAAILAMKLTDSVHPPAGAYAVLLADVPAMKSLGWKYILFPGFTGAVILLAVQFLIVEVGKALGGKAKRA